jgi:hypothetical protein
MCNYRILHTVSFFLRASMFSVCLYLYELYPPGSICYQLSLPSTREFKKFSQGAHVVLHSAKSTASTNVHIVSRFINTCYFRIITYEPPSVSFASDIRASVRFYWLQELKLTLKVFRLSLRFFRIAVNFVLHVVYRGLVSMVVAFWSLWFSKLSISFVFWLLDLIAPLNLTF